MAKMWKRIKNYIIKKLGGYTKEECLTSVHYEFIPREQKIITIHSSGTFAKYNTPPQDWIEDKLLMGIARRMKPYVRFEEEYDPITMAKTIYGYVKVVDGNG